VRWPGRIEAGRVGDYLCYQPDVLPQLAELTGTNPAEEIDFWVRRTASAEAGLEPPKSRRDAPPMLRIRSKS